MKSVKLSITCRQRLEKKYPAAALATIDRAIAAWIKADVDRDIQTIHVAVDDQAAMNRLGVPAVSGTVTASKVKRALDALVARLTPAYIVLFGAHDVLPMFLVPNPSAAESGDDDDEVPTDNPYRCSKPFSAAKLASYLVPDRVVGRIPDLPGTKDPSWLLDYLQHVTQWKSRRPADYRENLLLCTHSWKDAGTECAQTLGRTAADVMICPPTIDGAAALLRRRRTRLHMIKCHGVDEDSRFFGERGTKFPEAIASPTLVGHTSPDTVVGAMCCYGADLFDPTAPTAQHRPEPPIPSVYLKQGAHGFFGSSTIAWVGVQTMMCADWMVTAFLKGATSGASLGRASLEAKQDFLRWLQQQGEEPDVADEKTLIQFVLLGDPSIHPVSTSAPAAAVVRAGRAAVAPLAPPRATAVQRQRRRAARHEIGAMLRTNLPGRHEARSKKVPAEVAKEMRRTAATVDGTKVRWKVTRADRLTIPSSPPELERRAAARVPGAPGLRAASAVTARQAYQYYWVAQQRVNGIRQISMVTVQADGRGRVTGSRVVVSS